MSLLEDLIRTDLDKDNFGIAVKKTDEVTKNTMTSMIPMNEVTDAHGNPSSITNSFNERSASTKSCAPLITCSIAILPNTDIQNTQASEGTNNTDTKNSRTVRPRDTRAMNIPTNGDHAIHQAQ